MQDARQTRTGLRCASNDTILPGKTSANEEVEVCSVAIQICLGCNPFDILDPQQ